MSERGTGSSRARFVWACVVGGFGAAAVFAWVVFTGRADALAPEALGGFYDAQARSLLHGHWDVPADVVSFERFAVGGKYYTYFGPWPAVLRMPVVAFTDQFDGRLSRLSMLVAFVVLLGFAGRVAWQARTLVRGTGPLGWRSLLAAGGFVFVVGCGSTALFLASRAWVYHEAILWAVAWSVAAFSFVIAYLVSGRTSSLVGACVTATLALLSRPGVGLGPVLALGLVLAVRMLQRGWDWWSARRGTRRSDQLWVPRWLGMSGTAAHGSLWQVAVATAVPLVSYMYVNHAKFGALLALPYDKQDVLAELTSERRAALAATGNSLLALDYVPTNLVQYFRPDAIGFQNTFPWVTFSDPPHVFGGVVFDNIEPSTSLSVTSVFLFGLTVIGIVAAIRAVRVRRRNGDETDETAATLQASSTASAAAFRIPLLSAAIATAGTLAIADSFQRYEGDFVPLLVLGAALGLFWLGALVSGRARWIRATVVTGLVVSAAWSCWAMFGLTIIYQRGYTGFQSTAVRAGFLGFQLDVNDTLGLDPPAVRRGSHLPVIKGRLARRTDTHHGQLFALDGCNGLYISTGRIWEPVEEKYRGQRIWNVTFDQPSPPGTRQPLWSNDAGDVVWTRWVDAEHVVFEFEDASGNVRGGSEELRVEPGRPYELKARLDPKDHYVEVKVGNRLLLSHFPPELQSEAGARLGRQDDADRGATRFDGTIRGETLTPLCDRLTR